MSKSQLNARQVKIRVAGATGDSRSMVVPLGTGATSATDLSLLEALEQFAKEMQAMKGHDPSNEADGLGARMYEDSVWSADKVNELFKIYTAAGSPVLKVEGLTAEEISSTIVANVSATQLVKLDASHHAELAAGANSTALELEAAGGYGSDMVADSSAGEAYTLHVGSGATANIGSYSGSGVVYAGSPSGAFVAVDGDINAVSADLSAGATVGANLLVQGEATIQDKLIGEEASFSAAVTMASTLGVSGAADLDGSLNVQGEATLQDKLIGEEASFSAAVTMASTLGVSGAADLDGSLNVQGEATLQDKLIGEEASFSAAVTMASTLGVSGAADLDGSLDVAGGLVADTAKISDLTTQDGIVFSDADGELRDSVSLKWNDVTSDLYVDGDVEITGGLSAGSLTIGRPEDEILFMAADGSIESKSSFMFIDGGTAANDKLDINGELDVLNNGIFRGDVEVVGDLKVLGDSVEFKVGEQLIEDMIIKLGHGLTANSFATHDAGFVFEYGGEIENNMAIFWDSDASEFKLADVGGYTGGTALFPGNVAYSDLRMKDLKAANADLSGALSVTGSASIIGTLNVQGEATLQDKLIGEEASFSAAVAMASTLGVSGAVDLDGTLNVQGEATLQDKLIGEEASFSAAVTMASTLGVSGAVDLDGSLNVQGEATLQDKLIGEEASFSAAVTMASTLGVSGAVDVDGVADFAEAVTMGKTLNVAGETTLQDKLIAEEASFSAAVDMNSSANLAGVLTLDAAIAADRRIESADFMHLKTLDGNINIESAQDIKLKAYGATAYDFEGISSSRADWDSYVGADVSIIDAIIENAKGGKDMSIEAEFAADLDGTQADPAVVDMKQLTDDNGASLVAYKQPDSLTWTHLVDATNADANGRFHDISVFVNGQLMMQGKDFEVQLSGPGGNYDHLGFYFNIDSGDTIIVKFPKILA